MNKLYPVQLATEERKQLHKLIASGTHKARVLARARVLLLADQDLPDKLIAQQLELSLNTVLRVRKRFALLGLQSIYDRPHPGRPVELTGDVEAKLLMLACSAPPKGRANWTLVLLANKMVELRYCPAISREQVRQILKKTGLSLGARSSGASLKPTAAL